MSLLFIMYVYNVCCMLLLVVGKYISTEQINDFILLNSDFLNLILVCFCSLLYFSVFSAPVSRCP